MFKDTTTNIGSIESRHVTKNGETTENKVVYANMKYTAEITWYHLKELLQPIDKSAYVVAIATSAIMNCNNPEDRGYYSTEDTAMNALPSGIEITKFNTFGDCYYRISVSGIIEEWEIDNETNEFIDSNSYNFKSITLTDSEAEKIYADLF